MEENQQVSNIDELLDQLLEAAHDRDRVSVGAVFDVIGRRSFGPVLLTTGIITSAPILGDIPGVPTIMSLLVLLIGVQLLFRREHIWLPDWLLRRSIAKQKLCTTVEWSRKPARFLDRLVRPRLTFFTGASGTYLIAVACVILAATMPAMELVPFSANGAGAALVAFGLALVAHDGVLAIIALTFMTITLGVVIYVLL